MGKLGIRKSKKKRVQEKEASSQMTQIKSTGTTSSVSESLPPIIEEDAHVDVSNSEEATRASRKRSWIWNHFKEYTDKKVIKVKGQKDIVKVTQRAKCIHCPKGKLGDYACDSASNGNSGMLRHINNSCKYYPGRRAVDKNQKVLSGDKIKGNSMKMVAFNTDAVMRACVEMVVVDELPFSFVEKQGFRHFCHVAVPLFKVPCRKTLVTNFLKLYDKTKKKLKSNLSHHRVCLTTDTWTSVQNMNYMVLTAHFIDDKWEMHKRIINFCIISSHSGNNIGLLIEACLLQWGINKVLTITVDNAAANKCAIDYVRSKLNKRDKPESILGGQYMHVRCTAHICNLIVGSGLKILNRAVLAIRNAVKFVRSSSSRLDSFKACVIKEEIPCRGLVVMDVPTRWNSTFLMLEAALTFKAVFARMEVEVDTGFAAYFREPDEEFDEEGNLLPTTSRRAKVGPPSEEEWAKAEVFVHFLRVFYNATLRASASTRPTIHTTFHDVLSMQNEIGKLLVEPANDNAILTRTETEKTLYDMAGQMKKKFLKYFGSYSDLNLLVFMGLILDPRCKLRHITHLFINEGFTEKEVEAKTKQLKDVLMSLYEEYAPKNAPVKKVEREARSTSQSTVTNIGSNSYMANWSKIVSQLDEAVVSHEVDKYLLDPLEASSPIEKEALEFPILLWWRMNGQKYPVLAAIAKDVMAIQVSTVASESAFSTGGRVIDNFRSSLTPRSVEALICLQSWLRGNDISCPEDEPCIFDFEFYEQCERDHATTASSSNCPPPTDKGKKKVVEVDVESDDELVEVSDNDTEMESESEDSASS